MTAVVGAFEADRSNGRWNIGRGFLDHDGHGLPLTETGRHQDTYTVEVACGCGETTWVPARYWLAHGVAA